MYREVDVEIAPAVEGPDEIVEPAVVLRFRVRKLTSELLAEQGTAILFTDLPADLSVLGADKDLAALQKVAEGGEQGATAAQDVQRKIKALRGMGAKFFKDQARNADAVVCAGVVGIWQTWAGPNDDVNPAPTKDVPEAIEAGGYWVPASFTLGTPEPSRGRFPLTALSKPAREQLAKEISEFSLSDGGIADAMRGF
jgi:hypothetical protein